tara:strand:- start:829 stop:981 length:153 start_codon:yes stop_codon:yes gene_type:complete
MKFILNIIKKIIALFKKTNKKPVINITKGEDEEVIEFYNEFGVGLNNIIR